MLPQVPQESNAEEFPIIIIPAKLHPLKRGHKKRDDFY